MPLTRTVIQPFSPSGECSWNEFGIKTKMPKTLSATDVLAPTTMKNAAKCDTSCELQILVSHQNFERNLHFRLRKYVCWSVCSSPQLLTYNWVHCFLFEKANKCRWTPFKISFLFRGEAWFVSLNRRSKHATTNLVMKFPDRISNQTRIPAEFKHINKRRKRN